MAEGERLPRIAGRVRRAQQRPEMARHADNLMKYLSANCVSGTYWAAGPWWSYSLSVEPMNGQDRPQMSVLQNYTVASCTQSPTTQPSPQPPTQSTPQPTPAAIAFTVASANTSPASSSPGQTVALGATVKSASSVSNVNVNLEVRNINNAGVSLGQRTFPSQSFASGETKSYSFSYTVPSTLPAGTYCVVVGVASSDWVQWHLWNGCAAQFTIGLLPLHLQRRSRLQALTRAPLRPHRDRRLPWRRA